METPPENIFEVLEQITHPTGPILSWKARIYLKHLLTKEDLLDEQISARGKQIAQILQECALFSDQQMIAAFAHVQTQLGFNVVLNALYDACNEARILVL